MSLSDLLLLSRRDLLRTLVLAALALAACLWVSFHFLEPIPPRRIVLASGPESGLYYQQAQRYKQALAREGVTLEVRITEGGAENLRLLLDPEVGSGHRLHAGTTRCCGNIRLRENSGSVE